MTIDYCESKLFLTKSDNLNKLRHKNPTPNHLFALINCHKYSKLNYAKNHQTK